MVFVGLGLDVFAGLFACFLALGESEVPVSGGDDGELLDDIEVTFFRLAAQLPALGDGAGEDLLGCPGVGGLSSGWGDGYGRFGGRGWGGRVGGGIGPASGGDAGGWMAAACQQEE